MPARNHNRILSVIAIILTGVFLTVLTFGQFESVNLSPVGSVYAHDVLLVLLGGVSIMYFRTQKKHRPLQLFFPIVIFVLIGIFSLLVNSHRFTIFPLLSGSLYLWRFALYALLYWIVVQPLVPLQMWKWGLYATGVTLSVLGLFQVVFVPSLRSLMYLGWDEHYGRLFSTFLDPNYVGIYLVLTVLLGMHLLMTEKHRVFIVITQFITMLAIVLTFSRSTYLALGGAIIVWAILSKNMKVFFVIALFILGYLVVPKSSLDVNRLDRIISTQARITNWEQSIVQFTQAPLFGVGFNTLKILAGKSKLIDAMGIPSRDAAGVNSSLLFVLITTGLVGGAAYLYLLTKEAQLVWMSPYKIVGMSALAALLIHSLFNNSLFYAWIMMWWWIFLGIAEASEKSNHF